MAGISASVTSSGFDVAADVQRVQELVSTLPDALATSVADTAASTVVDEVAAIRGTLSVSGLGATLGVVPSTSGGAVRLSATPAGAWSLVNDGAKPHGMRVRRRSAMPAFPYGVFSHIRHPGTSGDQSWDRAVQQAEPGIDEAVTAACNDLVVPGGG